MFEFFCWGQEPITRAQWRETLLLLSANMTAVTFSAKSAIVIQDSRGSVDYKFLVCGTWIPEFLELNSRFQCQILGSTGEKVLGFWNSELLSIGWWNYLGGIIRVLFFLWGFDSICLVIESNYFIGQTTDLLANDNYILFSIVVTIYAVKNPSGNNTDLNEKLSRAKEYLTKDEILDALLDDDGNLSPNLTNNKELEVGCKV